MNVIDLIEKKKLGQVHTQAEIDFLIKNYLNDKIADYQMSAWLMAVIFQGLNFQETTSLTIATLNSGQKIDLSSIKGPIIDKHSTGGIGDKLTLIVGPIMASLGVTFAKMSGKGLGFTGGTIDKLLSIDGFNVDLSNRQLIKQLQKIKMAVISQNQNIVPADKKIYALRDASGTTDSIPLISASIMSKKIAMGAKSILLDVKCGDGAFTKTIQQAQQLAKTMIEIGKKLQKNIKVEISNMNNPLGQTIGNKIEVLEAIEVLKGQGSLDLQELTISSCVTMLKQTDKKLSSKNAQKLVKKAIDEGLALEQFKKWIQYQGGDLKKLFSPNFWKPKHKLEIYAFKSGFLKITSAIVFGQNATLLGAGRIKKDDIIDYDAGIYLHKKTGQKVKQKELLFTLYSSKKIDQQLIKNLQKGYQILKKVQVEPIILKKLG